MRRKDVRTENKTQNSEVIIRGFQLWSSITIKYINIQLFYATKPIAHFIKSLFNDANKIPAQTIRNE